MGRLGWRNVLYDGTGIPAAIVEVGSNEVFRTQASIAARLCLEDAEAVGAWRKVFPEPFPEQPIILLRGADREIEKIARIFGHSDIRTTLKYLGLDHEDMSEAMKQYAQYQKAVVIQKVERIELEPDGESGPNRACTCCEPDILSRISIPVRQCKASSQNPLTFFSIPDYGPESTGD